MPADFQPAPNPPGGNAATQDFTGVQFGSASSTVSNIVDQEAAKLGTLSPGAIIRYKKLFAVHYKAGGADNGVTGNADIFGVASVPYCFTYQRTIGHARYYWGAFSASEPQPSNFGTKTAEPLRAAIATTLTTWNYCWQSPVPSNDFDGDGFSDVALAGVSARPWSLPFARSGPVLPVAFSNGDGTFRSTTFGVTSGDVNFPTYATHSGAKAISGDFNGDGFSDLAFTGGSNPPGSPWQTIPVAFSNGDGTFSATNLSVTSGDANFPTYATHVGAKPVVGDFNGDGVEDIALTGGQSPPGTPWRSIPVAFSSGDGTFAAANRGITSGDATFTTLAAQPGVIPVVGDFNNDGMADIALTSGQSPRGTPWRSIPLRSRTARASRRRIRSG